MTVLLTNIRMTDKKTNDQEKVRKPVFRKIGRSKTINLPSLQDVGHILINEGALREKSPEKRSPAQPALSCQALKHAVSALTRIDDFILEEIGGGFFANVYKATHKVTGQEMVMKVNKDYANRSSALREVQLMNRMSHPNILKFLGVCVHEGQLHALTEYISGGTLEALLADKTEELPWVLRIKLSLDIAQGMHYLHSEGIFHRDLTSKNILIKKGENKNYQAVIADFGLATKIPDPDDEPLPPVGCPWWMAPEVIHAKFYDERADLFSFGIILLEIATRIEADPEYMPRTQNFGVDYLKVCELVEYCPLDFLQLAFRCCQILPERRPSASIIKITLERIYKYLRSDTMTSTGKLRKRSKSEDNIIQSSESFTEVPGEEIYMTPQIVAQAMTKDDPHYCPTSMNPFANISRFKDGKKVLESPVQRKCSGGNSGLSFSGKHGNLLMISDCWNGKCKSQSLPCSPIMLRKAAEKLHLASLLGSDLMQTEPNNDLQVSVSSDNQLETNIPEDADRRMQFSSSRTRSLGSLDFWNPRYGPGSLHKFRKCPFYQNHSEKAECGKHLEARIQETSVDDQCMHEAFSCSDNLCDEETFYSEFDSNVNCCASGDIYHSFNHDGSDVKHQQRPHNGREDSLSTSSLSSFLSCWDIAEEEETTQVVSDLTATSQNGKQLSKLTTQEGSSDFLDVNKPQIATESGSYDCNHFSLGINYGTDVV